MNCEAHTDCKANKEYCTDKGRCELFADCLLARDGKEGHCPQPAPAPGGDCAECQQVPYCKGGGCYCAEGACHPKLVGGVNLCENTAIADVMGVPLCK